MVAWWSWWQNMVVAWCLGGLGGMVVSWLHGGLGGKTWWLHGGLGGTRTLSLIHWKSFSHLTIDP